MMKRTKCRQYRYVLWRRWAKGPTVLWVMLNPSTADAEVDDATVRKCVGFTRRWGCAALIIVNLCAYRTRHPKELLKTDYPVGSKNHAVLTAELRYGLHQHKVAAWGNHGKRYSWGVRNLVGLGVECLGLTKQGEPKHPLMLAYDTPRVPFHG